ncbi:hypothetical protein GCM10007320_51330 [Pseudorhodoferax aquiterrae]|uniref:DUF3016 domain-containing protein n=1 Tax=Pseudorhodoferax aquiterrae TaxID=747304 RepID=A0ABQ3G8D3_9BURK|nr:hypothetical protein GCM10007320_51330 [Pseudorhodoferax aquiterrae]
MPAMPSRWALLLATAMLAACATPRPTGAPPGAVSVSWSDPARFSDTRENHRDTPAAREAWLSALARHLAEKAAAVLPRDEKLEVRITDVQRAGGFEPWRGPQASDLRVVRDVYPPRIDLDFQRLAADGRVLQAGSRQLRDATFLMRPPRYSGDPLRFEKALLDDWVAREFGASH